VPTTANLPFKQKLAAVIRLLPITRNEKIDILLYYYIITAAELLIFSWRSGHLTTAKLQFLKPSNIYTKSRFP